MTTPFPAAAVRRVLPLVLLLASLSASAAAGPAPADTVRSNLWWTESLMRDVLRAGTAHLPADGATVLLTPEGRHAALDLMRTLALELVEDDGHEAVLLDEEELAEEELPSAEEVPYELRFRLEGVTLEYPRAGRRLGLWRTWVDRDLEVSAVITVRDRRSGRLLMDDRVVRAYADRLPAGRMAACESRAYDFTRAEVEEGGIPAIFEEVVVLGALTGLVVAYFATTAD